MRRLHAVSRFLHRSRVIVTATVILGALLQPCAAPSNVAVNDLIPHGVDSSSASIISDRLRSELITTGRFRVMERGQMDQILQEQAFQQSGACDQSECAVQIGKMLSVDRMIVGSVGKIGELFTMQARVLNVGTGEIMYSTNQDVEGRIEDVLTQSLPALARKLAAGSFDNATLLRKGDVYVTTSVAGATVLIDGEVQSGVSPLSIEGMESGSHVFSAVLGSLSGTVTMNVVPDELTKVNIRIASGTGGVKVVSEPMGAVVLLDGTQKLGETPIKIGKGISAGAHRLTFAMDGFQRKEQKVLVEFGKTTTVNAVLVPLTRLIVSIPKGVKARVTKDSLEYLWLSENDTVRDLPAGRWSLFVDHPDYEPFQQYVSLKSGATVRVVPALRRTTASMQDSVAPAKRSSR